MAKSKKGDMPRLDKTAFSVTCLNDTESDKAYWREMDPVERLLMVEVQRRMAYGEEQCAARLEKVLEVVDLYHE